MLLLFHVKRTAEEMNQPCNGLGTWLKFGSRRPWVAPAHTAENRLSVAVLTGPPMMTRRSFNILTAIEVYCSDRRAVTKVSASPHWPQLGASG